MAPLSPPRSTAAAAIDVRDLAKSFGDVEAVRRTEGVAAEQVGPPQFSADGTTAAVTVPLIGRNGATTVNGDQLVALEKRVLAAARANAPPGLVVHSAGVGGLLVAFIDSFSGIDGKLLLVAGIVVVVILLIVYRSPIVWIFPLFSAVLPLHAATLAAGHGGEDTAAIHAVLARMAGLPAGAREA